MRKTRDTSGYYTKFLETFRDTPSKTDSLMKLKNWAN